MSLRSGPDSRLAFIHRLRDRVIQELRVRVINAATGELIHQLTLDPTKDYQPRGTPTGRPKKKPEPQNRGFRLFLCRETSQLWS